MLILFILVVLLLVALIVGPSWWVQRVIRQHAVERSDLPGTGGELAEHLIQRFQLEGIGVEKGEEGQDHFDPIAGMVRLSPSHYDGRSLSAVAVATHEVGHAIQHHRGEVLISWRTRMLPVMAQVQKIASIVLMAAPLVGVLTRAPQLTILIIIAAIALMASRLVFHLFTLPVEWDASFGKALPILVQGQYLPEQDLPAVRSVLKAAAMTYVAAALIEVLQFWRWIRYWR